MSKKLFIGNLPFSASEEDLKKEFAAYGTLEEVVVIKNKFSGRSKGFGFVTLSDEAMAQKAITEMNGKDVGGRQLIVNEAKPMVEGERRPRRSFGRREGSFGGGFRPREGGRGPKTEKKEESEDEEMDEDSDSEDSE